MQTETQEILNTTVQNVTTSEIHSIRLLKERIVRFKTPVKSTFSVSSHFLIHRDPSVIRNPRDPENLVPKLGQYFHLNLLLRYVIYILT